MKILTVIGTRPQLIKSFMVSRALKKFEIEEILVNTGQHYDPEMDAIFCHEFKIKPDYNLKVGSHPQGHQTGLMITLLERIMISEKPDYVLIYGDTNSTLAGAISAVKLRIPIGHVEAGVRTHDMRLTEEINRVIADRLSTDYFVPSDLAVSNLLDERVKPERIQNVGDVMYDVFLYIDRRYNEEKLYRDYEYRLLDIASVKRWEYLLCTIHREENVDNAKRLRAIFEGLGKIPKKVLLPVHPRTKEKIKAFDIKVRDNVRLIPPLGYLDFFYLSRFADLIITDSGGVQKEAYYHRVHCLVLSASTCWKELIEFNWNYLVEPEELPERCYRLAGGMRIDIYGNGTAGEQIAEYLKETYNV